GGDFGRSVSRASLVSRRCARSAFPAVPSQRTKTAAPDLARGSLKELPMPILDRDHDARTRFLAHMVGRRHRRDAMRIDDLLQAFESVAKASAKLRRAGLARLQRDGRSILQQD